jgi:hypothetical protein
VALAPRAPSPQVHAAPPGVTAVVHAPEAPGGGAVAGAARALSASARVAAPPAAAARGGVARLRAAARGGPAEPLLGRAGRLAARLPAAVARAEAPLRAVVARGGTGRRADPVRTQRRSPVPWALLSRARLRAGWTTVAAEHAVPAASLRLVGVYGPLPLGAVAGVGLPPGSDRAEVVLRMTRVPGPSGDLVLARDVRTGALLRALVPRNGPVRRLGRRVL